MGYLRTWNWGFHSSGWTEAWEKALGLGVVNELDPRLGLLTSGLGGLKWNHSRVPWGSL